jgi:phosphotriesterase-related protein
MASDAGTVVTVDGRIDPEDLGRTLAHEHMFIDTVDAWYTPPVTATDAAIARRPVDVADLHYIYLHATGHADNLRLDSYEEARAEVTEYRRAGGDAVVDVTPKGVGSDPAAVRGLSRETGLQFVHGTAYYTRASHPDRVDERTVDELGAEFVSDIREGIDDTGVRAGIVGEIGLSGGIHEAEENVFRAAARAARRTGAPLSVHPPLFHEKPGSWWGLEVLDMAAQEDLPPHRVILCHQDLDDVIDNPDSFENQLDAADRGAFVEFDCWGWEFDNVAFNHAFPSDNWRIRATLELIDAGYASNLLFSQDVWTKIERQRYGGFGYSHVLENVLPRLRARGVSEADLETITVDNPRRVLTFAEGSGS